MTGEITLRGEVLADRWSQRKIAGRVTGRYASRSLIPDRERTGTKRNTEQHQARSRDQTGAAG